MLEGPWPGQREHTYEVGHAQVQWRQRASATEGMFTGARFTAAVPRERAWVLSNDYSGLGTKTPGIQAIRVVEESPHHKRFEVDIKVLWKSATLRIELDEEPPELLRFRMDTLRLGRYIGRARMRAVDASHTEVDLATWLSPPTRVPRGLVMWAQRVAIFGGIRNFLKACEPAPAAPST